MIVFMMLLGLLGFVAPSATVLPQRGRGPSSELKVSPAAARYVRLPMGFERNEGQTDGRVKYLARGAGYTVFLTGDEAVMRLGGENGKGEVLGLKLEGANGAAEVEGEGELAGKANYFIGSEAGKWRRDIPLYGEVRYGGVYPGIDLVYYGNGEQLEYDFRVGAGREARGIKLRVEGARKLEVEGGELVIEGEGGGRVRFERPEAYQERGGKKEAVEARYVVKGKEVGFEVGRYDRRRELVIDPVLKYATYLGGTGGDVAYGIAVDSSGNAYITGTTTSSNFPTLAGEQGSNAGSGDAFVTKLNTDGSALVYSTFLGGLGTDTASAIAISAGDAFITGSTTSSNFPVYPPSTANNPAFQTTYGGNGDAFISQLNSAGDTLVYSSYLGGHGADFGQGIAVDTSGNAYVTGSTQSNDFPTTLSPYQGAPAGGGDAFVSKVNFDGSALIYSTYLGGLQADVGQAITVDSSGNAYVAGYTFSTDFPIPTTTTPYMSSNTGAPQFADAFVAKLNSAGSALVFSTYLGGSRDDRAFGLALDSSGNIYVAGGTQSTDFPTTFGVVQPQSKGTGDAFVTKLNSSGSNAVYSTLLGGADVDQANGIAVDTSGDAFVIGYTQSSDFPLASPIQSLLGGSGGGTCSTSVCPDAFVAEVNPTGTGLVYSTYLGGNGADSGKAIALSSSGNVYLAGSTASNNFPIIAGAYQKSLSGAAGNAFVAELSASNLPGMAIVPQSVNFGAQSLNVRSSPQSVSIINAGTAPLTISTIIMSPVSTTTGVTTATDFTMDDSACIGTLAAGGGSCTLSIFFTPSVTTLETGQISITDNAANSPQTISLKGTGVAASTAVTVTPTSLPFGNQTVGTVSDPQTVTITNTGTSTLIISKIETSANYLQTNTCGAVQNSLNVGESCSVSVSFQPTASGGLNGALSIYDNASGSPQTVALSGTGVAVFTLSSSAPTSTILVGNASVTFPITATAPGSFTGNITLGCPASLTCSFSPATIFAGQTSTLTVSSLTAALTSPHNFNVIGSSGSQSTTVALTILLADYSLSVSPPLNTIVSGSPAGYTVALTPTNGFNKQVQFTCTNLPAGATCTFSPSSVTPSGSVTTSKLTVSTLKSSSSTFGPVLPFRSWPPGIMFLAWVAALALAIGLWRHRRFAQATGAHPRLAVPRFVAVMVAVALLSCLSACRPTGLVSGGTPTGNYTITVTGTLSSNTTVTRTTTFNLAVT
jgi:hypothetical protein